jgi:delta8-fatty-acid desaturase
MGPCLEYTKYSPDAESEADLVWREDGTGKSVQKPRIVKPRMNDKPLRKVTMSEVAEHNKQDDLWIVIDNRVYDCTRFLQKHPGGILPILNMGGKDSTDPFISYHPSHVFEKWLPGMLIAEVEEAKESVQEDRKRQTKTLQAFRQLRQQFLKDGLFETDYSFYAREAVKLGSLLCAAVFFTVFCSSFTAHMVGALLLGCFWQQLAFIGHDTGHNAITHHQDTDNLVGIAIGNFFGGISIAWWKRSHNVHHIVTNSMEHDPDIQHLPLFACNEKILQKGTFWSSYHEKLFTIDAAASLLVRHQHLLLYVIMAVARFNLYIQSIILFIKTPKEVRFLGFEIAGMAGFWLWFGSLLSTLPTSSEVVQYLLLSHGLAGILHVQIIISHFPMAVYNGHPYENNDDADGWLRLQLETTQDILCPPSMDWFHGGLQFQVCHHLFPRIPRHNLRKVHEALLVFCKEHGLPYHMATFTDANIMTLQKMKEAATSLQGKPAEVVRAAWKDCTLRDVLYAEG